MGFFDGIFNFGFESWIQSASKEELCDAYESERQAWMKNGAGEKTAKMNRLNREIGKRLNTEWENDPRRNKAPHFRWTDANRWDKD